ncbi:hypothetical protein SUGI_0436540 [Cryptomeria japonica]|nr:hypothetical protein SUGI_0436540 [Cryptomeria japonica]
MVSKLKRFYDWEIEEEDVPSFAWMMMVNVLFVFYFLKSGFMNNQHESSHVRSGSLSEIKQQESSMPSGASSEIFLHARASIECDIVKMENHIPLFFSKNWRRFFRRRIHSNLCSTLK